MGQPTLNAWKIILVVWPLARQPEWFPSIVIRYLHLNKIGCKKRTRGTDTSKYPKERTSTETPQVVASERGPGQWSDRDNRKRLERRTKAGDSPVRVMTLVILE